MNQIAANKNKIKQKIDSLDRESQEIQSSLNDELEVTKDRIANIGKIALGISGGLIFSAIIIRGLFGNKDNDKPKTTRRVYQRFKHQLLSELSMHTTNLLLGIAKDKLDGYKKKHENTENNDSGLTD